MQVYDVEGKKFGAGDKIMFQKNDKLVGVKNGQTGTIKSIDDQGNAKIRIGAEKLVSSNGETIDKSRYVECNLNNKGDKAYTYVDHAYCITSHKSQGSTYDKCIAAYDVSNHKTNFNEFYVAATRQKQDVTIYTNDKDQFKDQVRQEQDKYSTFDVYDFSKYEGMMQQNRALTDGHTLAAEKFLERYQIERGLGASVDQARERGGLQDKPKERELTLKPKEIEREIEHGMDL